MIQNAQNLVDELLKGNRVALSRSITLVESQRKEDESLKYELLSKIISPNNNAFRIGITGSPGVGKSSFIEAFGLFLIKKGHKVAVLAIDPSSSVSGGSILGDKTRMEQLSNHPEAYVRPSPSSLTLGGIAQKTRESIFLCEAAGYDIILIETVGVGQSEYKVSQMVDFLLMLLLPGSGDELQGVKRGIIEKADLIAINKADGDNKILAQQSLLYYKNALHLFPTKPNNWTTSVVLCSAIIPLGLDEIWEKIITFKESMISNEYFIQNRQEQLSTWVEESTQNYLTDSFHNNSYFIQKKKKIKAQIIKNKLDPIDAIMDMQNAIDKIINCADHDEN